MIKKKLFHKRKKSSKKYFFLVFFILILLVISILFLYYSEDKYFEVPNFNDLFYEIPNDRGGKKVKNLDIKSLHLNFVSTDEIEIINDPILEYSIQIFSSDNYNLVNKKLDFITKKNDNNQIIQENLLNKKDFFIVVFNHEINNEYLLLYKNFSSRDSAFEYCSKYLNFLQKCLIVNAQKLN